jgi:hypothetical protein
VRIQADKDFDFADRGMQDKFINEGQLLRPATHAVDYTHRPRTSLLLFLTDKVVADGTIPVGLQALYDQTRSSPATLPPMPSRMPPIPLPATVSPQPKRSSAAVRAGSRVRVKVKAKSEGTIGDYRRVTPSIATRIAESKRATWQRLEGGTDIHGEEKIRDEEF